MNIDLETGKYAVYGGLFLGGGGGGGLKEGLETLELALSFANSIRLYDPDELPPESTLICASLVGSPASANRFVAPEHYISVYRLFGNNCSKKIDGIITNEMGAQSSANGWVLAAATGLPLVDIPCNGRAHPSGVMGSLCLHEAPEYRSIQACMGGKGEHEVALYAEGKLSAVSNVIRSAASAADGFVTVLRNPISLGYAKKYGAPGALAASIELGRIIMDNLGDPHSIVDKLGGALGARVLGSGVISKLSLATKDGFDLGGLTVDDSCGIDITFWNEYMTAEVKGERLVTFPALIAVLDAQSGLPQSSAMIQKGQRVIVLSVPTNGLRLGRSMFNHSLLVDAEMKIGKELVKYA